MENHSVYYVYQITCLVLKCLPPNVLTCNLSVCIGFRFSLEQTCSVRYEYWLLLSNRILTSVDEFFSELEATALAVCLPTLVSTCVHTGCLGYGNGSTWRGWVCVGRSGVSVGRNKFWIIVNETDRSIDVAYCT